MHLLQAKVNNASLVGVGYTQTLRPGKCHLFFYIQLKSNKCNEPLFQSLNTFVFFRYEINSLCIGGWEEHQRWRSQTRSGPGVGGVRPLCHFIRSLGISAESDPERSCVVSNRYFKEMKPKKKRKKAQFSSTVKMETFPPASFPCGHKYQLFQSRVFINEFLLLPIYSP